MDQTRHLEHKKNQSKRAPKNFDEALRKLDDAERPLKRALLDQPQEVLRHVKGSAHEVRRYLTDNPKYLVGIIGGVLSLVALRMFRARNANHFVVTLKSKDQHFDLSRINVRRRA
jgi:hypothetical protein